MASRSAGRQKKSDYEKVDVARTAIRKPSLFFARVDTTDFCGRTPVLCNSPLTYEIEYPLAYSQSS